MRIFLKKHFKNEKQLITYFIENYKASEILKKIFIILK